MNLSAPKQVVFLIAVILAVLSLVSVYAVTIPVVTVNAYWFMTGAFVLLAIGNLVKGV